MGESLPTVHPVQTFQLWKEKEISDNTGRIVVLKFSTVSPAPTRVGGNFASVITGSKVRHASWVWKLHPKDICFDAAKRAPLKLEL